MAESERGARRHAAAGDGYWPPQMLPLTPTPSESPMPQRRPGTGFRPDSGASRDGSGEGANSSGGGGGGRGRRLLGATGSGGPRDSPPPTQAVHRNGTGLVERKEAATMMQRWVRRNSGSLSPQKEARRGRDASTREAATREAAMHEVARREAAMLRGSVLTHRRNEYAAVAIQAKYRRFRTPQHSARRRGAAPSPRRGSGSDHGGASGKARASRRRTAEAEEEEPFDDEGCSDVPCVMAFLGHEDAVTALELLRHPGGAADVAVIASSSLDATVRVWNPNTGQAVHVLTHEYDRSAASSASSSSSSKRLRNAGSSASSRSTGSGGGGGGGGDRSGALRCVGAAPAARCALRLRAGSLPAFHVPSRCAALTCIFLLLRLLLLSPLLPLCSISSRRRPSDGELSPAVEFHRHRFFFRRSLGVAAGERSKRRAALEGAHRRAPPRANREGRRRSRLSPRHGRGRPLDR